MAQASRKPGLGYWCFGQLNENHGFLELGGGLTVVDNTKKKRNGSGKESIQSFVAGTGAPASSQRNSRKRKSENPVVGGGHGKTDTASVLHEAMGYIRFLQEQVQVLCSPYLKTHPSSLGHFHHQEGGENGGEEQPGKNDMRSRGLCLVPVESIAHVSSNNGADYWSPAAMGNHVSPNH
ncbi:hypothetical protein RHGRI_032610 [Rhododendron griersonianum]|uniref:BHLH domain-containing protein n=1 Tax=Rhododendron griersonianum TaxID=479676 RepID=A0AAV6IG02_9ERIC|nr:hypothetical protein RHGRI_032610 [Rhododendron griersonianum]